MIFRSRALITQYFGINGDYYEQFGNAGHEGIDLVPEGTSDDILCPWAGQVMAVSYSSSYGNNIIIYDAVDRLSFRFAHLDEVFVSPLQVVLPGQVIGTMGETGNTTGPHLHLNAIPMVYYGKKAFADNQYKGRVDPLPLLWAAGVKMVSV